MGVIDCNLLIDGDFMNKDVSELVDGDFYLFHVKNNKTYLYKDGRVGVAYFDTNGKVPVRNILLRLPTLIEDLIYNELELRKFLPQNGWGTYEGLISFLCDYLKECYKNKDGFVYCCR